MAEEETYYQKNRVRQLALAKKYQDEHREKYRAYNRTYYMLHKEKLLAKHRTYFQANKVTIYKKYNEQYGPTYQEKKKEERVYTPPVLDAATPTNTVPMTIEHGNFQIFWA
jgi:hypothetical protein